MCDTIVIVDFDRVLFAKNSDRDANEGQNLVWCPPRENTSGSSLRCTYIEIPEVDRTRATLLSRPFWMWGAEMGTNDRGVTIGNEAVFTHQPYESEPGLIGMDLLRLGLERADTAEDAVAVIASLLEQYGQGGACGHESKSFTYHNSFLVADPKEAYVLETAGRLWEAERVAGARTISNGLTIRGFREDFADRLRTRVAESGVRRRRTQRLANETGSVGDLMRILQDHGEDRDEPVYRWTNGGMGAPCMHAGGVVAASQTASWVAELTPNGCRHWATGTAAPCTSLFKPVSIDARLDLVEARDVANESLWWRHEAFHRRVMRNPARLRGLFDPERRAVQERWLNDPPASPNAFAEADALLAQWTNAVARAECADDRPAWVRRYWDKRNQRAGLDLSATTVGAA